jgi:hypothetical protein
VSVWRASIGRGIVAAAVVGWCIAVAPMVASVYDLSSSADRSMQMVAVILVAGGAIPASLVIAMGFVPLHAYLRRRGVASPLWYALWGIVLMVAGFFLVLVINPNAKVDRSDIGTLAAILTGVGVVQGFVFWLGAAFGRRA